jgi:ATP synthase protein I
MTPPKPPLDDLERQLAHQAAQRARAKRQGPPSLARQLAMVGALGWTLVVPVLGGAALGRWLDGFAGGGITFSAGLIVAGAALGFWMLWRRMHE